MRDILDILYEIQNQSVATDKNSIDSQIIEIKKHKDDIESKFSEVLNKGQEIPFDDFMYALDDCNEELKRIAFKKGFAIGLTIMKDAMKYSRVEFEDSILKLIEGMQ